MEKEDLFDEVVNRILTELYLLGKKQDRLVIGNYSLKNKQDLLLLNIAMQLHQIAHTEIVLKEDKWWKLLWDKFKCRKKPMIVTKANYDDVLDAKDFMKYIQDMYPYVDLEDIYDTYYKEVF